MAQNRSLDSYVAASRCATGYLDFARVGPPLVPVSEARAAADDLLARRPHQLAELDPVLPRTKALAAGLLGFPASQIALSPNTSTALFQVAFGLPGGEVLVSPFDFPANTHPWVRAEGRGGPAVRWMVDPNGPRPRVTPDLVRSALTPQTLAVAVSAVDFADGRRVDLAGVRDVIGDRLLIVDAIQALGVVDMPWAAADVIASGGQKWLRGGWGTGILACSARALDRLGSGLSGWSGAQGADDPRSLTPVAPPRGDVERFSITAPDMIAAAGFAAALDCLLGVGIEQIAGRVGDLVQQTRQSLLQAGATVLGADSPGDCSGIVAFTVDGVPSGHVVEVLATDGITVSERSGGVRVSIHASTDEDSVNRLAATVAGCAHRH